MSSMLLSCLTFLTAVFAVTEGIIVPSGPVATSYASMIKGDGSRYSYGIGHAPYPYGGVEGESFPRGYGGLSAAYAPSYAYDLPYDVSLNSLVLKEPLLIPQPLPVPVVEYPYPPYAPYPYLKNVYDHPEIY